MAIITIQKRRGGTPKQWAMIGTLMRQTGATNVPEPEDGYHASQIIDALIRLRDSMGLPPCPTERQVFAIKRFGEENGREYKIPKTQAQATALLDRLQVARERRDGREFAATIEAVAA
jgi:hypothetical protein